MSRRLVAPGLLRRSGRRMLAGGAVLLAAAIAVGLLVSTGGDSDAEELGNGLAAIDAGGDVTSFTESEEAPGNVAVGDGAVWVLDNERQTVSRIDPETKRITKTFKTRGVPSELAVGEGALWIGNAGGREATNAMVSVSRVDPKSGRITKTVRLHGDVGVYPVAGAPRIAVGAGAVWAASPDGNVARIDPDSGRIEATVDANENAWTVAAGKEGVWFISDDAEVSKIDPRTNRVTQRIPVGAGSLLGVAVGAGSVWAAANEEGVIWRIDPGRTEVTRTIDVGVGVTFVAFGEGSVWTGNYVDGTVSRIDPATNRVEARTSVSAPQALAAGAGSAWVSVAAGTTEGALTVSGCGAVASGGRTPDVLIASDLPLQGQESAGPRALQGAIQFIVERHRFRAGKYSVGYQSCDVSTAQTGGFEFRKCAATASAFAHAKQLVAVVGPWSSFCGQVGIPILNRAPGGPLATVSPVSTHPGLTRGGRLGVNSVGGREGEPHVYYPTGVRNFARLMAREDLQGVANAMLAKELGLKRVYVLYDPNWNAEQRDPFLRTARHLGVRIAGLDRFRDTTKNGDAIAERVARSGAPGVYISGLGSEGGGNVLLAVRARLGTRVKIMAADPFIPIPNVLEYLGPAARGLYISATDFPPTAPGRSAAGLRFARDFGVLRTPQFGTLQAAQATELVLDAIARSDGTRASVLEELRGAEVKDGILGDFRLDRYGDITPVRLGIYRVTGRTPLGESMFETFQGTVLDRVITVPARLSG
jgi:branched-chain amino acid transport system substrate-binding protein